MEIISMIIMYEIQHGCCYYKDFNKKCLLKCEEKLQALMFHVQKISFLIFV